MIEWPLLLSLIACYFLVLVIATLVAQKARVRLVNLVDEMLAEEHWNRHERDELNFLAESCSSAKVSLLLPVAALYGLAEAVLRGSANPNPDTMRLDNDPRHTRVAGLYMASLAGNSPFAMALALPIALLAVGILALRGEDGLARAMDIPLRHVSTSFQ